MICFCLYAMRRSTFFILDNHELHMRAIQGQLHGPSYRTLVVDTLPFSQATAWCTAPAAKLSILQHQHLSCMDASRRKQGRALALPMGPRGSSHIQYHAHGAQPLSCPIWARSTTSASHPTLALVDKVTALQEQQADTGRGW